VESKSVEFIVVKSSEKKTKTIDEETKSKLSKMKDEKLKRPASKVSKAQRKVIKVRKVKKIAFGSASANMLTKSKPSKDKTPTEVNNEGPWSCAWFILGATT